MERPVEKLLVMDYSGTEREKRISNYIFTQIDRIWDEDFVNSEWSVGELLSNLKDKPNHEDKELVKNVLELLIAALHDEQTVSILVNNLDVGYRYRSAMFAGWFGKRGRKAIPLLLYHAGGAHFSKTAQQALRRIGVSKAKLFSTIKRSVREKDGLAVVQLLFFTINEYPGCIYDSEIELILQHASESSNAGVRGAVLEFLEHQDREIKLKFKPILIKFSKNPRPETKEAALKILVSIISSSENIGE